MLRVYLHEFLCVQWLLVDFEVYHLSCYTCNYRKHELKTLFLSRAHTCVY